MPEFQTGVEIKAAGLEAEWVPPQRKHEGLEDPTWVGDALNTSATIQLKGCA